MRVWNALTIGAPLVVVVSPTGSPPEAQQGMVESVLPASVTVARTEDVQTALQDKEHVVFLTSTLNLYADAETLNGRREELNDRTQSLVWFVIGSAKKAFHKGHAHLDEFPGLASLVGSHLFLAAEEELNLEEENVAFVREFGSTPQDWLQGRGDLDDVALKDQPAFMRASFLVAAAQSGDANEDLE